MKHSFPNWFLDIQEMKVKPTVKPRDWIMWAFQINLAFWALCVKGQGTGTKCHYVLIGLFWQATQWLLVTAELLGFGIETRVCVCARVRVCAGPGVCGRTELVLSCCFAIGSRIGWNGKVLFWYGVAREPHVAEPPEKKKSQYCLLNNLASSHQTRRV